MRELGSFQIVWKLLTSESKCDGQLPILLSDSRTSQVLESYQGESELCLENEVLCEKNRRSQM